MIDWGIVWGYLQPYITGAAVFSGIIFWIKLIITEIVKFKYTKKLEEYKYQIEVRKKAELVAQLLAHWLALKPEDSKEELNRLACECYLWLPDNIARNLADLLAHQREDVVTVRSVLIDIRKHLNKDHGDYKSLTNNDLTIF